MQESTTASKASKTTEKCQTPAPEGLEDQKTGRKTQKTFQTRMAGEALRWQPRHEKVDGMDKMFGAICERSGRTIRGPLHLQNTVSPPVTHQRFIYHNNEVPWTVLKVVYHMGRTTSFPSVFQADRLTEISESDASLYRHCLKEMSGSWSVWSEYWTMHSYIDHQRKSLM